MTVIYIEEMLKEKTLQTKQTGSILREQWQTASVYKKR